MDWVNKIDRIVCFNLQKRTDRLLEFTEQAEKYEIPFERFNAIEDKQQGARGLRDSMVTIFTESIAKEHKHVIIFEDDCDIIQVPILFHETMNRVMEQIPETYHMVFLGCQLTSRPSHFHSPNLIPVIKAFSTHAVMYSLQGMKEILSKPDFHTDKGYPIDNWMVEAIQPIGQTYCTYPLLCSQKDGISDIGGGQFMSWKPFIEGRFDQKIAEMGGGR